MECRHGVFEVVPWADGQNHGSLFNLCRDNNGDLFCCNLKGEIFKLENNALTLFYRLEKEHIGPRVQFLFDKNNDLIICSSLVYNVTQEKVIYNSVCLENNISRLSDDQLLLNTLGKGPIEILFYRNDSLVIAYDDSYFKKMQKTSHYGTPVLLNGKISFFWNDGNIALLKNTELVNEVTPIESETYFQLCEEEIIAIGKTNGVRTIQARNNTLFASDTYFTQFHVSTVALGKNQNKYYGTFGRGVIVVPNDQVIKHNIKKSGSDLLSVASDHLGNVFLTQREVGLVLYDGQTKPILTDPDIASQKVFYSEGVDFNIHQAFPSLYSGGGTNYISSVKDAVQVGKETSLLASSIGVFKIGRHSVLPDSLWSELGRVDRSSLIHWALKGIKTRCKSVAFNPENQLLYVATQFDVLTIDAANKKTPLLFKGKPIVCNKLIWHNGAIWMATASNGILVYRDETLYRQYNQANGLFNENTLKIEIKANKLFVAHKTGVQVMDLSTEEWVTLGQAEGIIGGLVRDFSVSNDRLWLLANDDLLSINLTDIPSHNSPLKLQLDSLVVAGKKMDWTSSNIFKHDQNNLKIYLDYKNISCQEHAVIYYRMAGFEVEWNQVPSTTNLVRYKSLPAGNYTFEAKVRYGNTESEIITSSFQIIAPYWERWWFTPLIVLLTSIFLFLLFFYRIRSIRQKSQEKLEKKRVEADLLESQLKALRSQMNPHFIFNSLNSIQDLILKEETDASYDYIVLFADLVRSTLNYSNQEFIPIEKELEFLNVYLSLEKLRFKEDFNYNIIYTGSTDIQIPSLIVQPFIENALIHGLLHKGGPKDLDIEFKLDNQLICLIKDNGIGRKKAKEIQQRQGCEHESFALEAIKKRLSILTEQYGNAVGYKIHDLYANEEPIGTCVEITMPYSRLF